MFCRWLEPEQLGQWDVAFGFLNLAAPLAVLGLPGSFGRYVEYFRQRGQFHVFLRRTTFVSAADVRGGHAGDDRREELVFAVDFRLGGRSRIWSCGWRFVWRS